MNNKKYYVTFGCQWLGLKDNYIIVYASGCQTALDIAMFHYGKQVSTVYDEGDFDESFYPKGCLETINKPK